MVFSLFSKQYFPFMRTKTCLIVLLSSFYSTAIAVPFEHPHPNWQDVKSVEQLWTSAPQMIRQLVEKLNLEDPKLGVVEEYLHNGDTIEAMSSLLLYFNRSNVADWLLRDNTELRAEADSQQAWRITRDSIKLKGSLEKVPRTHSGGWNWQFQGTEHDAEFGYSLNGHRYFASLLIEWQSTGDEKLVQVFDERIRDWIIHNPVPPAGDSMYLVFETDLDWRDVNEVVWRTIQAGQRLGSSWPQSFYGFQKSDQFTPAARILMLYSIPQQAEYLMQYHKKGHNWTTMEMNGLALAGLVFPEFKDAHQWTDYALRTMEDEINGQVYPDGVQTELSTKTQWVALRRFESIASNFKQAGRKVNPTYLKRVEQMYDYLAKSMRPDGGQPLNNDSDKDDLRERVIKAANDYAREDWKWIATNGNEGTRPSGLPSTVFPWAGIHIMRNGWQKDAHWSFFDTGVFGTGHQHSDMLHLSISAYEQDFLVDGGRYTHEDYFSFDPATWRGYFRSSYSHNVILIDEQGQDKGPTTNQNPMKEGEDYLYTSDFDFARGTFDSGYENVEGLAHHTRSVTYLHDRFWIVIDAITTDRPRKITTLWHFAPKCTIESTDEYIDAKGARGYLRIVPLTGDWHLNLVKGQTEPHYQGWYSMTYGEKEPNTTAEFSKQIAGYNENVWMLIPYSDTPPTEKVEVKKIDTGGYLITIVTADEESMTITIPVHHDVPSIKYD